METRSFSAVLAFSRLTALLCILAVLGGCASFGEGVARGLVGDKKEDTRRCYVRGPTFDGIEQLIEKAEQAGPNSGEDVKVIMVHGIGTHLPGYSTRLAENLARELKLDIVGREPKTLTLRFNPSKQALEHKKGRGKIGDEIGTLRVNKYRSKSGSRAMTFYELTWSQITESDKKLMAYDDSGEYTFRRAGVNRDLKHFVNQTLPDPLIYLGDAQLNIQLAVSQSLCWMMTQDYEQLPQHTDQFCDIDKFPATELRRDSYVFVSHSLGSRILADALQLITEVYGQQIAAKSASRNSKDWHDALQAKTLTIFMLSNQLPLLQLGREAPEVINQYSNYCTATGTKTGQRMFARTNIIAFSDPNDILSWAVPPDYEDNNMDSRMCPVISNVIINIAEVTNVLGVELASPGEAHRGYDNDQRVIKLMARGMSEDKADPMVRKRCEWLEVR